MLEEDLTYRAQRTLFLRGPSGKLTNKRLCQQGSEVTEAQFETLPPPSPYSLTKFRLSQVTAEDGVFSDMIPTEPKEL